MTEEVYLFDNLREILLSNFGLRCVFPMFDERKESIRSKEDLAARCIREKTTKDHPRDFIEDIVVRVRSLCQNDGSKEKLKAYLKKVTVFLYILCHLWLV
jgi:hypothetical protein